MYLDDGMGGASAIGKTHLTSITVLNVLKSAGFLIAEDKCNWLPSHNVTWLGMEHGTGGGICNREENYKINEYFRSNL